MSRCGVLGLDLGTRCGYAYLRLTSNGLVAATGVWDCSFKRDSDSPAMRLIKFENNLSDFLALGIGRIFYENVRSHNGTQAAHVYGSLKSKMMEVADRLGIPYEGLEVAEVKKYATGKGNANKSAMIDAANRWGFTTDREDEADAICVARCGWDTR